MMLSRQLLSNLIVPHDIIRVEFTLPPMLVETKFRLINHSQSRDIISRQVFEASPSLQKSSDTSYWYSTVVCWLFANGLDINNLPPLRYNHETDTILISHENHNNVIHQEVWQIFPRHKWMNPLEALPSKSLYYKEHFMYFSKLGFIIEPKYLDTV